MKIGIISDTHDAHQSVLNAIEILKQHQVEYVLHAGDIISPFTAKAFADLGGAKFIAVFGNNEGEKLLVASAIKEFGGQIYEYAYKGTLGKREIFMTHVPTTIEEVAQSGEFNLVIYGHTHKQDIRKVGKTLVVNPGEATDWLTGKSTMVILELDDMSYESITIE